MRSISDVNPMGIDFLEALAAMAPAEAEKTPASTMRQPENARNNRSQGLDLGPVDVGKYLNHYGHVYNIKDQSGKTLYRLEKCLFDPSHGQNEAAIIQDSSGKIAYQCFHNTCQGKTWADARAIISGADKLAQFCAGYDPNWQPPKSDDALTPAAPAAAAADKPAEKKSPRKDFITFDDQGRPKPKPVRLANYIEELFSPLYFEGKDFGDVFYRYHESGVWRFLAEATLRKVARHEFGDLSSGRNISETIQLLKDQAYVEPEIVENNPMILNVKNGMLDVTTMKLTPHAPHYYSRVQMPVSYDPDSKCPLWEKSLFATFADDPEKMGVLQQFFGYCLYPKILFPCALFQIGGGGNGKGLVEFILCQMLGKENVSHISMARMEKDFGPVEIRDKLLNSCGETETGQLDVTNFKKIASGDEIQAEVKYKSDAKFTPIAKHMISMNAFPGLKEKTQSFFRRIIVLEYNKVFDGKDADVYLKEKLLEELDGIFLWALDGLQFVLEAGEIVVPECVVAAKQRFREKSNPVLLFVEEACIMTPESRILPNDLYQGYKDWCDDGGMKPLGKQNFYEQIRLNYSGIKKRRDPQGTKEYFYGIENKVEWGS